MAQKEYFKMADMFDGQVTCKIDEIYGAPGLVGKFVNQGMSMFAAHAINSHDELVADVERLRELTEKAFIDGCEAGFALSAEGVNGEYNVVSYESMMGRFKSALIEYKKGL